ncbi:hypothetical protein SPRG_19966 [Saprolegnia parasitica CBS 223.65]|uniref:VPS9 domain-containing protein n=1 Tax=Saprolegnia parasitica (strain CBS 223.65) TaxID=695850 RepID=A0A067CQF9_SAPPC|nr:hypothetical protein SPRG_19966 [Saprolegnia parasitica CBS 223.65]KDO28751.1 hypothetical protein SPRG_19966 [Saprolegnia parasitica CBS 223.65]|eukprot:XP_012200498.1 hypothetical protein SPRG_19966 [Saprolegnia parasitica CBS 223.65]
MLTLPWHRRALPEENRAASSPHSSSATSSTAIEPTSPAHVLLSTERRDELLHVARTKRISWVEGMGIGRKRRPSAGHARHATSTVLECTKCADELMHFMDALELAPSSTPETPTSLGTISLLDEIVQPHGHTPSLPIDPSFRRSYNQLLDVLRHADAADLVHTIQTFLKSFQEKVAADAGKRPASHFGERVQHFVTHLMHLLQTSPLVQRMERQKLLEDFKDPEWRREALEAFLMEKLHATVFPASSNLDAALYDRIASLRFLDFAHLDITATSDLPRWKSIQDDLSALPRYLSPRRMMTCILHVCQELTHLLRAHHGRYPGADEFLPALIYTILKANPVHLHSVVQYIQNYRHPSKLLSEPGYFFTHVVSSVSFLEQLDDSGLSISPEDFHAGLAATKEAVGDAGAVIEPLSPTKETPCLDHSEDAQLTPISVLEVRARRRVSALTPSVVPVLMTPTRTSSPSFLDKTAADLRLCDIPLLLDEYKALHRRARDA